jgi:aspartyl-tRNA(Asn)/glutamyl-tRNA(Gln) amidotransferase subunit B
MSENILGKYKLVLGLEIHLHLDTERKMFCRCSADIYGAEPNSHTCPTCLGLPGALPVPNKEAIKKTQLLGLTLNSKLNAHSRFDRKHYFYPDLPKGYQISQYKKPLCLGGYLELEDGGEALIERIHLEEDTAKSAHEKGKTLIDFNMSSMPLVEIVTKPTFKNVEDAVEFAKKIQLLVRELGLGNVDMEKGQLRLEPNISLRSKEMEENDELPQYKVEIKNINSFKFMENAVKAEIIRQKELLDRGETPLQENRGYLEHEKRTVSQRAKEEAHDYRYFPEPDIPPMEFSEDYLAALKEELAELRKNTPSAQKRKLLEELSLENTLEERLVSELTKEEVNKLLAVYKKGYPGEKIANLFLNRLEIREMGKGEIISELEKEKNKLSDEDELAAVIAKVLKENEDAAESYKAGKESALQFLTGMVMRETKGKADAETSKKLLLESLKS